MQGYKLHISNLDTDFKATKFECKYRYENVSINFLE